jgi:hypothetical protein
MTTIRKLIRSQKVLKLKTINQNNPKVKRVGVVKIQSGINMDKFIRCSKKESMIPLPEVLILASVAGSIVFSLVQFFICQRPFTAIFIGLWAPTLMSIVNYINIKFK